MFCVKCGVELPNDCSFCPKCGVPVLNVVTPQSKNDDEQILLDVGANFFRGIEAVGGRLKITSKRLIFTSHLINVQFGTTEIPINNIEHLEKAKSLGLINNQMIVVLKSGVKYKFVINNRDDVINVIDKELKRNL
jgi:hypothetical protein